MGILLTVCDLTNLHTPAMMVYQRIFSIYRVHLLLKVLKHCEIVLTKQKVPYQIIYALGILIHTMFELRSGVIIFNYDKAALIDVTFHLNGAVLKPKRTCSAPLKHSL